MPIENPDIFSSVELNQYEISSEEDDNESLQGGSARSRPVRTVAKKRKNKVVAKGRKKHNEEMDDVFIE